jgi:hypothetical protein
MTILIIIIIKKPLDFKPLFVLVPVFDFTTALGFETVLELLLVLGLGLEMLLALALDTTFDFVVLTFNVDAAFFAFTFVSAFAFACAFAFVAGFAALIDLTVFGFTVFVFFPAVFDPSFFTTVFDADFGFDVFAVDFFECFPDVLLLS